MERRPAQQAGALLVAGLLLVACQGPPSVTLPAYLGDPSAQALLGYKYLLGDGVPRDYAKALEWTKKAAAKGHGEAMDQMGFIYATGKGVPPDFAEGARWFRKAADLGVAHAMDQLAYMYASGKGVALDYEEAL